MFDEVLPIDQQILSLPLLYTVIIQCIVLSLVDMNIPQLIQVCVCVCVCVRVCIGGFRGHTHTSSQVSGEFKNSGDIPRSRNRWLRNLGVVCML